MTAARDILPGWTLQPSCQMHRQCDAATLTAQTVERGQGRLNDTGALCINTGAFTGRSPQDRFIVRDAITDATINWGGFNNPTSPAVFAALKEKIIRYLDSRGEIWVRDGAVSADPAYRLSLRVVTETPWASLFARNMFLRPDADMFLRPDGETLAQPDWCVLHAPGFLADPAVDGTRQANFAMISFTDRTIIIGGTGYTGEIKKGIFSVLNFLLPQQHGVLSMHCSANIGPAGDVAVFFGLSGTGKTTLSTDPGRDLIGDDEHGWSDTGVFNIEGGCYAKTIDLDPAREPDIYHAIRPGALVENVGFIDGSNRINFADKSITENTRVSYPVDFIPHARIPSVGGLPRHIFFLTCDALGVLPPISRLSPAQAMYQFISGYTAKVAGTETGITEPKVTFSACFGAPFMPLHPGVYARLLGDKIRRHDVKIWMVNTGWSGGAYGTGQRMKLSQTRAMITAAMTGALDTVSYAPHPVFGFEVPQSCPSVPAEVLNPRATWADTGAYDAAAAALAAKFVDNFKAYESGVDAEIRAAAPRAAVTEKSAA